MVTVVPEALSTIREDPACGDVDCTGFAVPLAAISHRLLCNRRGGASKNSVFDAQIGVFGSKQAEIEGPVLLVSQQAELVIYSFKMS
jgi:hypothetical protein